MDNSDQVLIVNATQLQSIHCQFEYIIKELAQLLDKKKYKKAYSMGSLFLDRYDHSNQIHLHDKIHCYNILLLSLTKMFRRCLLKDMSKKNIIDIRIQKDKIVKYSNILPIIIQKVTHCFDMIQIDTKQRIREQIRNSVYKDQLSQQINYINKLKLDQVVSPFHLDLEFDIYLRYLAKAYRLLSYQESHLRMKYAEFSYQVSKLLLNRSKNRVYKYYQYLLASTNYMIKLFEANNDKQAEIIQEINDSEIIRYVLFLSQHIEQNPDPKIKIKCRIKLNKLIKPLIWFWFQTIYYYQSIFNFGRCQQTIAFLKWATFYYLRTNDELTAYIQGASTVTFSVYKEFIIFNQVIEGICLDEQVGMVRLKELMKQKQEEIEAKKHYEESVNHYYDLTDKNTNYQPPFIFNSSNIKVQHSQATDLAFIEIPVENLSSMDTRQSSKTLKCPKRMNSSFNITKSFRGSISQFSSSFSEKKENPQIMNSQQPQQLVPILDKMIQKMIENKITLDCIQNKTAQSQLLLSKERLQQKENDFYKKLLKYKTQFSKFQSPVSMKSNQEFVTKQDLQMRIIEKQTLVDQKNEQPLFLSKQNDHDTSLLSFEKLGVKITPLQKLRKIIFKHSEVFHLQKLRNKLKSTKKWYNRANSVRITNARRSIMAQKSKEQQATEIIQLRERSQTQLRKKLSETQFLVDNVDKAIKCKSQKLRQTRLYSEQPLNLDSRFQNLSGSIIKQGLVRINN